MGAYEKRTSWHFQAGGESWAITDIIPDSEFGEIVYVEETRKNGQEDSHVSVELGLVDGAWDYVNDCREHVEFYLGKKTANALLAYIQEHGLPE